MELHLILEMADIEVLGVKALSTQAAAEAHFEQICEENQVHRVAENDLTKMCTGTVAFAGDDAYGAHWIKLDVAA